ncbi:MAG: phenylacetate--CoA ligase family protein [Alphaproteobacteria bacterium]
MEPRQAPIRLLSPEARRQRFWNERTETMPRERLDALHVRKLKALVRYCCNHSPFYRRRFDEIGLRPEDIRTLDDFKYKIPTTDKSDIIHLQAERPPYGPSLALPAEFVHQHFQTSGTTGTPLAVPFSLYDAERYGDSWNYGFWAHGIRPGDSMYFCFAWGGFAGFWSAYWGARRMNCRVLSGGGADTKGHIANIMRLRPTVVLSTPSYAFRLAAVAEEMGVDLRDARVKFTYHGSEPGGFSLPAVQESIDRTWGAKSGEMFGISEVGAFAFGCPNRDAVHLDEMSAFSWVMDPKTGKEVAEGEVGENIVTSYVQSAQPLLNYRTHDLMRPRRSCSCGRTWTKFDGVVLGRTDFMVTIRAVNVYQSAVENVLGHIPGVSHFYQLVLTRERDVDEMTVEFEPEKSVPQEDWPRLAETVAATVHKALNVRLSVTSMPPDSLPRYELKTKRIIDKRPKEFRRALDR